MGPSPGGRPPGGQARRRRPLALRVGRGLGWLVAAALALIALAAAGVVAVLQTEWGRGRVRLFALERLREAVHGRVEVERLGGDFLHGVTLEGVSITGPAGEPFVHVKRMQVDYQLGGFLRQKILLGEVVLEQPQIALVQDAQGEWNYLHILPFLSREEKPKRPGGWGSVVRVRELRIENGTLGVATEEEARRFGPLGSSPELTQLNGMIGLEISALGREEDEKRVRAEHLSFVLNEERGQRLEVRELDARATLTPAGLELRRFLLRTPSTELSGEGVVRDLAAPLLDVRFQADPLALAELRGFTTAVPFEGTVRGTVELAGPLRDLEVTLKDFVLQTPRSRIAGRGTVTTRAGPDVDAELRFEPFDPADVRLLWSGWPIERPVRGELSLRGSVERLGVEGLLAYDETTAGISGTLGFGGREPAYDLLADVRGLDLQDVLHAPSWASLFNGQFRLAGQGIGTSATAEFSGRVRDSRVLFYDIVRGSFSGRFRPGAFEVASFEMTLPRSVIRGSGLLPYNYTLNLRMSAASRNLEDFFPGLGPVPAARFEGSGTLSGPFSGIDLSVAGTADSIAWNGLVADSLSATALFTDLGRSIFRMSMDGTGTGVDYIGPIRFASGDFHLGFASDTMGVTVDARVDSVRTAQAHLNVDFSGTRPLVVLDRGTARLRDETWTVEGPSGFAYRDGVFRFEGFALVHAEERAAIDGTLSLEGRQDFSFDLRGVSLDDFQTLAGIEPRVTGIFNGSGKVTGTDRAPVLDGQFSLAEGRVGRLEVHRLGGTLGYADRRLRLDVELAPETLGADSLDPGSILLRGSVPVNLAFGSVPERFPDEPVDLEIESRGLSLALVQALSPDVKQASGPLQFRVRLAGRPSAPRVEGELSLEEGRVGGFAVHSLQGRIDYADRELKLDMTFQPETEAADRLKQSPGSIQASGTFPVDLAFRPVARRIPDRPIDLRITSEGVSLALLRSFSPRIAEASGPVALDVRLGGSPSAPRYSGEITVRNGALRLADEGVRYTGINGTVGFDNDRITFDDVRVGSPGGEARLTGQVALRELALGDIRATLTARRFTVVDEDVKKLVVDADVELAGTTRQPAVTGKVNVEQAEWPLPEEGQKDVIDLDEAILYVRAEGETTPAEAPPPSVWRETLLNLDVNVEDDAILKSDRALIVLQGGLSIEKRRGRDAPSIAGELEVVRGLYADFGTQFEVKEGEVFFYGTPELNPGLHVVGTQTVRDRTTNQDVEVTLTLGGTVERPTLEVTSNPAYDKAEIFSLLLFGTPSPGAGQEGQFQSTVTRVASRQAALPLQRALASELGLDIVEIQPGVGAEGTSFRVGKYIASDVFVTYSQATGPFQESQFGLQYRLSPRWTVETQAGTRQFGADIFYEFRY